MKLSCTELGAETSATPLVLLHGLLGGASDWHLLAERWAATRRVVSLDLRGHGRSPAASPPLTLADLAADVCDTLLEPELGLAHDLVLAGASLGGMVALHVAARLGGRVRALVLAATDPRAESERTRARRLATLELVDRLGAPAVLRALAPTMFGRTTRRTSPELVARWLERGLGLDPRSIRPVVDAALSRADATPLLGQIRCPVLVLAGDEDEVTPPDASEHLCAGLASSRRVPVPRAGHSLHLEQPAFVAEVVGAFLQGG